MYALLIQHTATHGAAPSYEYHSHLSRTDAERLVNDAEQRGDVVVGAVEMPSGGGDDNDDNRRPAKLPHPEYAEYVAQMDQATAKVRQAAMVGGAAPMKKAATFAASKASSAAFPQRPAKSMSDVNNVVPQPLSATTTSALTNGTGGKRVIQDDDEDETPAAAPTKPAPTTTTAAAADAPKRAKTSASTSTSKKSSAKATVKQASVLSFFKKK